ncbi:putative diacetyl reductase [(R)-acetoin forming] 2 [Aspergillus tubingensis]|uniref:Diacetyl reductase [(R)-acetoin forming] 2 n=1 Tax=Aspergillus tubingensis TaxID=5068 RepID=A0A9W6AFK8_ASPTU|nr:putative diacetyl reductase [(R)-acetoin forming] 2 [Aspergillus tubingensis]GLA72730.1 putative diacetyl reductase [(R)-acetoin forming] 2 [Aspergillus tubingensis]GLA81520.1 putative diacetyl reductase [(R)-acetoin forming] 2 [Aspergillus tubingensis]
MGSNSDTPAIPWMQLGELDPQSSLTPPPAPFPSSNSAADNARQRFAVRGNAIFTGGAGALALTSARALLEHGLQGLALLDLPTSLTKSKEHISAIQHDFPNANIVTVPCNVTIEAEVQSAVQSAIDRLGDLRILCCFAGIVNCVPSVDMSLEDYKRMQDVNATGSWVMAQTVARHMISRKTGGKIVLIASISGHRVNYPQPQLAYNISKASILHMKSCLAAEWAQYGIHVNSISPGYMDTVLNEGDQLSGHRAVWADRNPMRRMGSPQELTGPVVLLCSDVGGSYLNGVDIVVDGGGLAF